MLIGSSAAKHWFPDFRKPRDTDYITHNEMRGIDGKMCPSFNAILEKYPNDDIAPPIILYTLKLSHSFWDIHWEKTTYDLRWFQSRGITAVDEEIYALLYKDWENIHGKKKAYLNKSNKEFFRDGVNRQYIHDDIHRAIAFYDEPLYERIKNDKSKAMTSHNLFLQLSKEDRLRLCQEETFVTALERFIIPSDYTVGSIAAYHKALKLLVTSMTRGWFPRYIMENFLDLTKPLEINYVSKFKTNIQQSHHQQYV